MKPPDQFVLGWIALTSVFTFFLFAFDKWRAKKLGPRISELQLILLSAIGGWPGGLLAMLLFRHKTAKGTFKLKFSFALVLVAAGLAFYWHWRKNIS